MKKIFLTGTILFIALTMQAQTSAIERLFEKYADREGFTTITISGKLLGLFAGSEVRNDKENVINSLSSIKILTVDDSTLMSNINFYRELGGKSAFAGYEELMDVKEGQDVTKFLIKQNGDRISELIVISGGPGDNTLISIKGDLDLKSLSELSEGTGIEELKDLEKVEGRKP
ncbi:MAG: DUF4252 domain-containing protein [Bacteroidales bacterium]|jgi:hypothetical protein|nr:DUF4252 domain-containing protein [Bacteroidales bacterium]